MDDSPPRKLRLNDTSPDARDVQMAIYRKMSPQQRLQVALQLSQTGRRLLGEGIRLRHPEYSDQELRLATIRAWLGADLFRTAYPDEPELDP